MKMLFMFIIATNAIHNMVDEMKIKYFIEVRNAHS